MPYRKAGHTGRTYFFENRIEKIDREKIKQKQMRRNKLYLCTPAELAIYNAIKEVEKLGASVALTKAVNLLIEAKELVGDVVDAQIAGDIETPPTPPPKP
jgi:hypothetical protein